MFDLEERGIPNSHTHRIFFRNKFGLISPWHDIPLFYNETKKIYNMVVEIPRYVNIRYQISKREFLNPLKPDSRAGKVLYAPNCFPYHGYLWNYGSFPRTWENPEVVFPTTKMIGDNSPIDVLEIGENVAKCGDIIQVKVLGIFSVLSKKRTDWKVVTINVNDIHCSYLESLCDVNQFFPNLLECSRQWFSLFRVPDGKPKSVVRPLREADFAHDIIASTHQSWNKLVNGEISTEYITSSTTLVNNDRVSYAFAESYMMDIPELEPAIQRDPTCNKLAYNVIPGYLMEL